MYASIKANKISACERAVSVYSASATTFTDIAFTGNNVRDDVAGGVFAHVIAEGSAVLGSRIKNFDNEQNSSSDNFNLLFDNTNRRGVEYSNSYATPEGNVTAGVGSIYLNLAGGAGTVLWVKESGTGNTGWKSPLTTSTPGVPVNGPAFSAYSSTATTTANNTFTKILFQTEDFDTNSNYDTSTSRFTPTVAGYYQFNWLAGTGTQAEKLAALYKNGAVIKGGSDVIGYTSSGSAVVYMNGSTDYVEVYLFQAVGMSVNSYATALSSGFSGSLIRSAT
jgi:hypothetical protein